jgi:hypothetical protein
VVAVFDERSDRVLNPTWLPSDVIAFPLHRTSAYLNNRLEQDHRDIKGRIRCVRGFKDHDAADRFCREHDELRDFLRARSVTVNISLHLATATAFSETLELRPACYKPYDQ